MRLCESQTSHFPSKYCPSWSADSNRQMSCREQPPPHCECGTFPARRQKVWTPTAKPLKVNFTCLFCDYRLILLFNCPDAVNLSRPSGMPSRRKQCLRVIWSDYLSHAWRCVCVSGGDDIFWTQFRETVSGGQGPSVILIHHLLEWGETSIRLI